MDFADFKIILNCLTTNLLTLIVLDEGYKKSLCTLYLQFYCIWMEKESLSSDGQQIPPMSTK